MISTFYNIDFGDDWKVLLIVDYVKEAMEVAERGMFYTGNNIYIENVNRDRILVSEFVEGDPKINGHKYLKIVEKDGKKAYFKEWQHCVELKQWD